MNQDRSGPTVELRFNESDTLRPVSKKWQTLATETQKYVQFQLFSPKNNSASHGGYFLPVGNSSVFTSGKPSGPARSSLLA